METKSNILDSLKGQKSPFKVPEGYFKSLDSSVQKVIEEKEEAKVVSFRSMIRPLLYTAASVAVLVCAIQTVFVSKNNLALAAEQVPEEINGVETKVLYSHLEDESIIDYLFSEEE